MREITTLGDLKGRLQAGFENNEESLEEFGKIYSTQLKAFAKVKTAKSFQDLPLMTDLMLEGIIDGVR